MLRTMMATTRRVSAVQRYSQTKLINGESVLEHQGCVAFFCYCIGERLNQYGEDLNMAELLKGAVIHDLDEVATGDIPRPTKYSNVEVQRALEDMAYNGVDELSSKLRVESLTVQWSDAKEGKEGTIVALSDILSVLYKVWTEVVLYGNRTIVDHVGPIKETVDRKIAAVIATTDNPKSIRFLTGMRSEASLLHDEIAALGYKGEY